MTPEERAAIQARARDRAERMGYRIHRDQAQAPADPETGEEPLPTVNPAALRHLLSHGHLSPGQSDRARRLLAAQQSNRQHIEGDAA